MSKHKEKYKAFLKAHPQVEDEEARIEFAMKHGIELDGGGIAEYNPDKGYWEYRTAKGMQIVRI